MARTKNEVRDISELPDWFSLDKYKGAESLDAAGWAENLKERSELLKSTKSGNLPKIGTSSTGDMFHKRLNSLRNDPLLTDGWISYRGGFYPEPCVRQMDLEDLYHAENGVDDERRNYIKEIFRRSEDAESYYDALSSVRKNTEWNKNPLREDVKVCLGRAFVKIDLRAPDSLLVDQFKALLKTLKPKGAQVKSPKFEKWVSFGVLPYLDLSIWGFENGLEITNRTMADAIFPPGQGGEEVVRKTTQSIADELVRFDSIEKLRLLANNDLAEDK